MTHSFRTLHSLADEWWLTLGFDTLEQLTGLQHADYSPNNAYQAFLDACDIWWNTKTAKEKIKIFKTESK